MPNRRRDAIRYSRRTGVHPKALSGGVSNVVKNKMRTAISLPEKLQELLIGQTDFISRICPYIVNFQAGFSPENRPAGAFMLLGPTGVGKTHSIESLAKVLHGSTAHYIRIDCGEFQMEHEVAKLIGAPPGYLGHRETHALLQQQRLTGVTSETSPLSIILFDEFEKAADSMRRLLLGVLDKGRLTLGDNSTVKFDKSLVFFTLNVGASEIAEANKPMGFEGTVHVDRTKIADKALRKRFSPEFLNRVDEQIVFEALDRKAIRHILDREIDLVRNRIYSNLGASAFIIDVDSAAKDELLALGYSEKYGARELKRCLQRNVVNPLASLVAEGAILPRSRVVVKGKTFRVSLSKTALLPDKTEEGVGF